MKPWFKFVFSAVLLLALGLGSIQRARSDGGPSMRYNAVREHVNEVYAQPDFAPLQHHNSAMEDLGKSITNWLGRVVEAFQKLFRFGSPGSVRSSSYLLYPLLAVLVVLLAYIAAFAIAKRAGKSSADKGKGKAKLDISSLEEADSRNSNEWLEAAEALSRKGDYLQALRAVFVATLLRLDAAGVVTYEQSRTNGEYLRAVRKLADFYPRFRSIVNSFDAGWYGDARISESQFALGLEGYHQADALASKERLR